MYGLVIIFNLLIGFFNTGATALLATASALFKRLGGPERRRSRSRHRRSRSSNRLRDSRLMLVDTVESPPLVGDPPPPYSL